MASSTAPTLSRARLKHLLDAARSARVLVIGDVMLDEFVWGKVHRISPEAPVPVVWVQSESFMPGGAANVASNIRALGGQAVSLGVVGSDRWGQILLDELGKRGVDTSSVVCDPSRPTTVKSRVIANHQQVVRVDREANAAFPPSIIHRLIEAARKQLRTADAVIIEDYGKGVVTRALLETLLPEIRSLKKIVTIDPKEEHFDLYHGVTAITPNRSEAGGMLGRELETEQDVRKAGEELRRKLEAESVLITLGEDGMCLFQRSGPSMKIPTVAQAVFDVAGAGDTVIAAFTLALAGGASLPEAAVLANLAAGIVVGKVGVAVATSQELLLRVEGLLPTSKAALPTKRSRTQVRS